MLEIKNLSFAFGKNKIFDDINLNFEDNQITGIVGKNGVGKTTLFRIMSGIYSSQSCHITLDGSRLKPSQISFLPTEPYFYPYMKGGEYLEIVASSPEEWKQSKRYSRILDLPLYELVDNYSTGMRKKLAFSALFSLNRPVVILDEPYNGVDLEGNEIIKHIIKTNNRTKTVILSSHILSTITEVCDSIYHMSESSQIQQYPKSDFQTLSTVLELNMLNKLSELDEYS